jgi:antitoxin YefM
LGVRLLRHRISCGIIPGDVRYTLCMKTVTDEQARAGLTQLLEQTALSHEPIQINGENASGVLVAEEDWRSIEATLYLLSVPGMRESLLEGMRTPVEECSPELHW